MLNKICLSLGLLSAAIFPLAAGAGTVMFDPDGTGTDPALAVDALDFFQGNILSKDGVTAVFSFNGTPTKLGSYSHARLNAISLNGKIHTSTGLNTAYEITYVIGFPEVVTDVRDLNGDGNKNWAMFELEKGPGAAPEATFFELWWDNTRDSNHRTGAGFNNGTPILRGKVVQAFSNFFNMEVNGQPLIQTLDQYQTNDDTGISSTTGSGSGHPLTIQVTDWDKNFFPGLDKDQVLSFNIVAGNVANDAPFFTVDPSLNYTTESGLTPRNIGGINGISGPDFQFQTDINATMNIIPQADKSCRMTGGGVTYTGDIVIDPSTGAPYPTASGASGTNRYTFGGQIGAPTATAPGPFGEWTHHQFQGAAGDFVFHAGTHSAPPETKVLAVSCVDPGFCQPARPAPFKQLNWEGIGQFKNVTKWPNKNPAFKNAVKPKVSLHWVKVHYEDLGEPGGPNGAQTKNADCPDTLRKIGDIVGDPTVEPGKTICANCPDVYQITIYAKNTNPAADSSNKPIYQVGGYIDHGNIQLHPAIK